MTPPSSPERRKRQQLPQGRGAELREQISVAAQALGDARGGYDFGMRDVAAAVGVTTPAIYRHFASRNDLLYAVATRNLAVVARAMDLATAGIEDPVERIRRRHLTYLEFALANRETYRLLYMGKPDDMPHWFEPSRLLADTGLATMITDVAEAMAAGQFSNTHDPAVLACLIWMALHGVASLLIALPTFPYPPTLYLIDQMMSLLNNGFAPSGRTSARSAYIAAAGTSLRGDGAACLPQPPRDVPIANRPVSRSEVPQ
ncbi:MAG: Transcriptional regulator, TetR family [Pseudonocardiales bacterium]|nr:Transcriptional regulator, TetR family [Pseudonocardiales bacterium]